MNGFHKNGVLPLKSWIKKFHTNLAHQVKMLFHMNITFSHFSFLIFTHRMIENAF